jgi:TonB family protein
MTALRGEMKQRFRLIDQALKPKRGPFPAPTLLVEPEPWGKIFLHNLRDTIRPRPTADFKLASRPGDFWPDVFVSSRLPWSKFAQSAAVHSAVIALLWASARFWPQRTHIVEPVEFHSSDVVYYQPEEYLPPLDTGGAKPKVAAKGEPAYSPQPVISVPPDSDNRRQTIVTPPNLKLDHDVPLPNIVAWNRAQPAIPLAAAQRHASDTKMPTLSPNVVAPPPEVDQKQLKKSSVLADSAVAPAPDVDNAVSKRALPAPQAAVVAPPPGVELAVSRKVSDINIGHAEVVAPAPQLAVEEQHALNSHASGSLGNPGAAVVPPPPSMQAAGNGNQQGRMIALNLQPATPTGPVEVPNGNRRGTFTATPEGKPGAYGTPDSAGTKNNATGTAGSNGPGNGGSGKNTSGVPPGLSVGASPPGTAISAIARPGSTGSGSADPLVASATAPTGSLPRRVASIMSPDQQTDLERKVFASRKSYAMTLNVPNLNSAGGSWVMHFSELQDEKQGDLVAPIATHAVDPGYPLELMRENVRGTVTLSAVIRSDGSVGDVEVLNGIDDRLDSYARNALAHWHFLPAMKNGNPVALQAVVMIPFRPRQKVGF